ncbi:MAG: ribonuclease HII [Proteobacteria bacterium]|nr:ribonuclease HII [Pseudomonadota bacterium]MDA0868678.1 ribonuclease HII [Pseudomonadota bacterium]MDA1327701.1 ribonuclease HII [Pseudomonadota bacterium]
MKRSKALPSHATQEGFAWHAPGLIAGVDEAGRGPLAGPVVVAAVILDDERPIAGVDDSKRLSAKQRERLFDVIMGQALCVSIGQASAAEVDAVNVLQATLLAMRRAVEGLRLTPIKVLVDGNQLPRLPMLAEAVVGGDGRVACIAAASIVAKVTRDRLMTELDQTLPGYGFAQHKGYGTAQHMQALRRLGASAQHRRSFAPVVEADRAARALSGVVK